MCLLHCHLSQLSVLWSIINLTVYLYRLYCCQSITWFKQWSIKTVKPALCSFREMCLFMLLLYAVLNAHNNPWHWKKERAFYKICALSYSLCLISYKWAAHIRCSLIVLFVYADTDTLSFSYHKMISHCVGSHIACAYEA